MKVVLGLLAMLTGVPVAIANTAAPAERVGEFLELYLSGDTEAARDYIQPRDREAAGTFRSLGLWQPQFPSGWEVLETKVMEVDGDTVVRAKVRSPEIERLFKMGRKSAVVSSALQELYVEGALPKTTEWFQIPVIERDSRWYIKTGAHWRAFTNAMQGAPKLNYAEPPVKEVRSFAEELAAQFPEYQKEIAEWRDGMLQNLFVASNLEIKVERIDYNKGDRFIGVRCYVRNASPNTVEYLMLHSTVRGKDNAIVRTDEHQLFYSGSLPQGLVSGDSFRRRLLVKVYGEPEAVTEVELRVGRMRVR